MHKDYSSLINGKANLWKRMMLDYPAKLEEQLSPEDKELQIFLYHGVHALDTCFDPSGEETIFDLDIYKIDPVNLIHAYDDIVESLLCFYFFDYGYDPHLVKRYFELKNKVHQEVGGEAYMHGKFKGANSVGSITRECFLRFSEYFNIPQEQKRINDLYAVLHVMCLRLESDLINPEEANIQSLCLLKEGYELDNEASC